MKRWLILFLLICTGNLFAQGSLLLVGGGYDGSGSWIDEPFQWFVNQADSGIIIDIDTDSGAGYADDFIKLGADSASETMIIGSRSMADDSATYKKLIKAKAIFMHGGDQWDYVSTWKGTLVEDALHYIFDHGGAIGGTSAGLAVLGSVVFDAKNGSAYPEDVAYNPYNYRVHFTDEFLEILPGVITDSHFHERGRLGRLIPMLARRIKDHGETDITGIGVSHEAALCIDPDKQAVAYGNTSVTILYPGDNSVIKCASGKPVTFTHLNCDQLVPSAVYDLNTRTLVDPGLYLKTVEVPEQTAAFTDTVINGSSESSANLGAVKITRHTDYSTNAFYGSLRQDNVSSTVPYTIIMPKLYNDHEFYENRFVGAMWAAVKNPGHTVIYLDDGCSASIDNQGMLTVTKLAYILDMHEVTHAGLNGARKTNYCGFIGAKIHALANGDWYDLKNHQTITSIESRTGQIEQSFLLYSPFPNPFNPVTQIRYGIPEISRVKISIYDINGRLIKTLLDKPQTAGWHQMQWDGRNSQGNTVSSGVYFVQLLSDDFVDIKKMVLVK